MLSRTRIAIAALAILISSIQLAAQPKFPTIVKAMVDLDKEVLTLEGENFGSGLVVLMGSSGGVLKQLNVLLATDRLIKFTAIPDSIPWRAERMTPRPIVNGLHPAIVTSVADPDGLGKVKVRFPWLDGAGYPAESGWVKVSFVRTGLAGEDSQTPEVDAEVLVGFVDGDPSMPIVLGRLYNGVDPPAP